MSLGAMRPFLMADGLVECALPDALIKTIENAGPFF